MDGGLGDKTTACTRRVPSLRRHCTTRHRMARRRPPVPRPVTGCPPGAPAGEEVPDDPLPLPLLRLRALVRPERLRLSTYQHPARPPAGRRRLLAPRRPPAAGRRRPPAPWRSPWAALPGQPRHCLRRVICPFQAFLNHLTLAEPHFLYRIQNRN